MTKTWYPVIDEKKCIECGTCINFCQHGVYNKEKSLIPEVVLPDNCVQGCHGCGNICPVGTITYKGENTDWVPPKGNKKDNSKDQCCEGNCSCSDDCGC